MNVRYPLSSIVKVNMNYLDLLDSLTCSTSEGSYVNWGGVWN